MAERHRKRIILTMTLVVLALLIAGCKRDVTVVSAPQPANPEAGSGASPELNSTPEAPGNGTERPVTTNRTDVIFVFDTGNQQSTDLSEMKDLAPRMKYIIGDKASSIDVLTVMNMNNGFANRGIDVGKTLLASEVKDYKDDNYFVVGSPCENTVAAQLFAEEITKKGDCNIFKEGEGVIKIIMTTDKQFIIYVGANIAENTRVAGQVLANYDTYKLAGDDVAVKGTIDSPSIEILG